jgi:BASS family bile acid:Na+ symporter
MEKTVRIVSVVLLALIIVGIVIKEKENILDYFSRAGILAFLLIVLTISVGYITSKLFKLSNNQSTTIALESGIQNATMALTIATTILANTGYAVTPAIYGLLMYFPAGVLVSMHLRRNKTIT